MQYTETGKTWTKLSLITGHAQRDHTLKFISLAHLLDVEYLRDCYRSLNRNRAVGIDNISWEEYGANLDDNLSQLVSRLKRKKYKPVLRKNSSGSQLLAESQVFQSNILFAPEYEP